MKKISKGLLKVSLEEMKELYGEEGSCIACRCVAGAEDVEHLHVTVLHWDGSDVYEPMNILCGKCREALLTSPILKKLVDSGQFVRYQRTWVPPTIWRNAISFLRRGLSPGERIMLDVEEFPVDFEIEQETE